MRKNDAFVAKIVITHLTKGFMAMFAPAESLPSPATLTHIQICYYRDGDSFFLSIVLATFLVINFANHHNLG